MSAANTISTSSAQFQSYSARQLQLAIVYLLNIIAGSSTMTPNQIITTAIQQGFNACDERTLYLMEVYLLSQLVGSGSNAIGQVLQYTGVSPTAQGLVPNNKNAPALAYPASGSGTTFTWNTTTFAWQ